MSGYYIEDPLSEVAYLAYDTVWTLALGINMYVALKMSITISESSYTNLNFINRSLPILEKEDLLNAPFDYRENGSQFTKHITEMLSRLHFTGVSVSQSSS